MDLKTFSKQFEQKRREAVEFLKGDDAKKIIGRESVEFFKQSFENEGFTDKTLEKWPDVKRRDSASPWYGHSGDTGKFSQARTVAKILAGETGELKDSLRYFIIPDGVKIVNATVYAGVHQFGLNAKVYGKHAFKMLARPFIGKSEVLKSNLEKTLVDNIKQILTGI